MLKPGRPFSMLLAVATIGACTARSPEPVMLAPGGDAHRGRATIEALGCGACHVIPGVVGASGQAGPPLTGMGRRAFVAGVLPNTPDNLERWLKDPQSVVPGNAMPNTGMTQNEARDVAAYLYTLR